MDDGVCNGGGDFLTPRPSIYQALTFAAYRKTQTLRSEARKRLLDENDAYTGYKAKL
jgi:hypothetical protein